MNTKAFLSQARYLDMRITSKLKQIELLNELANTCTTVFTDMPRKPGGNPERMAAAIEKIIDLQNELQHDINTLVNLKEETMRVIKAVTNPELQSLLEKRYLCFLSWEQIAVDMGYSIQNAYRVHDRALEKAAKFIKS